MPKSLSLESLVKGLELEAHPEGGYYRESYRSARPFTADSYPGTRSLSTAIYYALGPKDKSHFHRLRSDEIWHHYRGAPISLHTLDESGRYERLFLSSELEADHLPQVVIRAGVWFAASVNSATDFALTGCTVAPGFDFQDFEMAKRGQLTALYPQHSQVILEFTRPD